MTLIDAMLAATGSAKKLSEAYVFAMDAYAEHLAALRDLAAFIGFEDGDDAPGPARQAEVGDTVRVLPAPHHFGSTDRFVDQCGEVTSIEDCYGPEKTDLHPVVTFGGGGGSGHYHFGFDDLEVVGG